MRRLIVVVFLFLGLSQFAFAQWTISGGNIYNSNTGNVGIGTGAGPVTWKFELVGNGQIIRNVTATSFTSLRLYNNQNSNVRSLEIDYSGSSYSGSILSGGATGEAASITTTGAYPLMFGTGNSFKMILTSAGNLGLGTNAPANKLEVTNTTTNRIAAVVPTDVQTGFRVQRTGTNATDWEVYVPTGSTGLRFRNAAFGSDVLSFTNTGNVGIGTTSPSTKFEVTGISRISAGGYLQVGPLNQSTDNFGYVSSGGYLNGTGLKFETTNGAGSTAGLTRMTILNNGKVGIGTMNPDELLTVNGKVHATEVRIDLSVPGPDYVFEKGYNLLPLEDVRAYIERHRHLPDVPSAAEMEKNGVNISEMNMILLRKVEELTLHVIELQEQIKALRK
jgi:hypothetical protein